ncbi:unnamed protein product [Hydatigera taeniaeformis]|uniref:Ldh_1_C domain-containing protein n=1 Tax=Hydatigena taeniaeformis TaxID=6205 RepID=A0A0R3WK10_HYDTA|nr:unnamed protein product [Hydatigera taeniaeformis]
MPYLRSNLKRREHNRTTFNTCQGMNLPGIDKDIFMSLPCIVNANGVRGVMFEDLEDEEKEKLYASAKGLEELILSINW